MIRLENHMGLIEVSQEYFHEVIDGALSNCYGVAGMGNAPARRGLRALLGKEKNQPAPGPGVRVYRDGNGLLVDLHVVVTYGLNIASIVRGVVGKVRYTLEESTGLEVHKVNVFVDGMLRAEQEA